MSRRIRFGQVAEIDSASWLPTGVRTFLHAARRIRQEEKRSRRFSRELKLAGNCGLPSRLLAPQRQSAFRSLPRVSTGCSGLGVRRLPTGPGILPGESALAPILRESDRGKTDFHRLRAFNAETTPRYSITTGAFDLRGIDILGMFIRVVRKCAIDRFGINAGKLRLNDLLANLSSTRVADSPDSFRNPVCRASLPE